VGHETPNVTDPAGDKCNLFDHAVSNSRFGGSRHRQELVPAVSLPQRPHLELSDGQLLLQTWRKRHGTGKSFLSLSMTSKLLLRGTNQETGDR